MYHLDFQPEIIGRDDELRELQAYLDKTAKGQGNTIFISGEAGIGKTRLVEELKQIAQSKGFQILSGNSMYESLTPFMPIFEALKSGGLEHLFAEEAPRVEAVYLVTHGGVLIKDVLRKETKLSPVLFTSMLTVVGNYVTETFSILSEEKKEGALNTLGYENFRILIESGKNANLVVLLSGKENEFLIKDMREVKLNVEKKYNTVLKDWDGDENSVMGIEKILSPLITSGKYDGIYYGKDDPKIRRNLLFENVSLGLTRYVQTAPTLLCIEDLQWIDPSSLALIYYIARNTKEHGLIILGTYRPEDVAAIDENGHPLIKTMQLMGQENLFKNIELQRLHENNMAEFISAMLGVIDFSDEFSNRIYRETEGNPLFLIQLMKLLVEEKIIVKENGTWKLVKDLEKTNIPSKIYNVILRRLNRVEKQDRKILDYASVIGEIFTPKVLADSLDLKNIQLVRQLEYVEQAHKLIHPFDGHYKFDHAKIKEVLYSEIPEELRMEYHNIVANSIETLNKDRLEEVIGDLAFHYYQCKKKDKALLYLLRAAEKAKREYSNEEAIRFYEKALELEDNPKKRMEMYEALGDIYFLICNYDKSIRTYGSAKDLVNEEKKPEIMAKIGGVLQKKGEYDECIRICTEVLDLVGGKDSKEKALAFEHIGMVYWDRADHQKALECFNKSLRIREKINDQKGIARSHINIYYVYIILLEPDKPREHAEKSLKISEEIGDQQGIAESLQAIGVTIGEMGYDDRLSIQYCEKSLKIWEKIGDQREIARALNNIGYGYKGIGEFTIALEYFKKSLDIFERIRYPYGIAWVLLHLGTLYRDEGDLEKALDYLEKSQKISKKNNIHILYMQTNRAISYAYFELKDYEKALYLSNEAYELSKKLNNKIEIVKSMEILGKIFAAMKNWDASIEYFMESYRIRKDHGPYALANLTYNFGLMWRDKGDIDNAKKYLNEALDIYESLKREKEIIKVKKELEKLLAQI